MFGKVAAEQILNIPLSYDTVRRRILTISEDIVKNVNEIILQKDKEFALQLDESTDVSGKSQLIYFIRFVNGNEIIEIGFSIFFGNRDCQRFVCVRPLPYKYLNWLHRK